MAKIISVIALSMFKHTLGGVPLGVAYQLSFFEIVLYTIVGGMMGVLFFSYLSDALTVLWYKIFPPKIKSVKKRKIFTKRNRLLVKVIRKYGLYGVAFLTPSFLSIPVGTLVANKVYASKPKIFLVMFVSITFWSFLGASVKLFF